MNVVKRLIKRLIPRQAASPKSGETLAYRVYLFEELLTRLGQKTLEQKRILEIGPRDGLDSLRFAQAQASELVMIDLPEKRELVNAWLANVTCPKQYIETNFMYMSPDEYKALGQFDVVWCTGVLYHNPEQLRMLRRLYKFLKPGGFLVLESATLRGTPELQAGNFVQVYFPETYRNTGTITHLPTAGAIKSWLLMAGFEHIVDSRSFEVENEDIVGKRYACICQKGSDENGQIYYGKSGLNTPYRFGDST
jgi:2-polyprenyl-3-methyl-5-hydroxy-6-metoxy-1,4-benzoquinol methylase